MKIPKSLHYLVLALLSIPVSGRADAPAPRAKYNFNSGWVVNVGEAKGAESPEFVDSSWKKVTLPYAWNEDSAFKVSNKVLPSGIAWYRKSFQLPAEAAGRKVFLEFEGIRQAGEFYLNGEWIGRSENGVMAFGFDVTEKIKPAPAVNVLAARINNSTKYAEKETGTSFQWNVNDFAANYGGINKNVFLHFTDKLHQTLPLYSNLGTTGVYVYAGDFDLPGRAARITAEAEVKNEYAEPQRFSYEVTIAEVGGKTVQTIRGRDCALAPGETKTVTAAARVAGLNFWSWGYGYLYDVTTTLKVDGKPIDSVVTRTGFRKLEFGQGMVKLNGRVIQFKGYAQRSTNEWPAVGNAVPPWVSDFSNKLMLASNANLVRWMHVTPGRQDVESCDRIGLLQALPAGDKEKDAKDRQWTQRVELMRDATIYNRNSPSVVMYEGGNESITEEHMADLKAIRDQYDPHGGRASGSREMLGSQIAEYGGEMLYINKSARIPLWATEYYRDEGLRKYWDDWTPPYHKDGDGPAAPKGESGAAYNRNQDSYAINSIVRWYDFWRERPGTGKRVSSGGVDIVFSDTNTMARGAANYRSSGEVDAMRIPKDAFYAHQVMWDGWVDVDKPAVHIFGHWNYESAVKKPIYAVSSADKVELFLNGQSKGFGEQSSRFLYTWSELPYQSGELKAVGYDHSGAKVCETVLKTAGAPAAIKLTAHTDPSGFRADGADLALVDVEIVDVHGNRCSTALNTVKFELQGPAEWRGGIADGPDNYILAQELPVEGGVNRVMLRSRVQAGKIVLTASSAGLPPTRLELTTRPFATESGVTKVLPDVGLVPSLARGPTPAGESFVVTRQTLHVVSATAGANVEQASMAFDDNEETTWKNDGKRASAWIEFELDRPSLVNELVLKLGGWRRNSYPLRVTVDGQEVYSGVTPKSLGYVTLPLQARQGKSVRVELSGEIQVKDEFGMVEVTGKKLADSVGQVSKGALEIVEAEIYGPVDRANSLTLAK